ncbi:3-deoxy-D-manno-octulosonic acid transferase [Marinicauda algicola]|uniref:3-deoxy-D-manno-octulosonic acid transferase n=1 Tax=Marinicauda algicola TaxID=2029849 RepID=A0A4S2GVU4_9PROT|nr:3-deoxy-D-manno-octulosonic acid transferase [Marinicauda algicola]TGY87230.1 3-deoxy-D-manno-octulosonic acid transferase [Marinicauda algicola]
MTLPTGLTLYRLAMAAAGPFLPAVLARRTRAGKEDPARSPERRGLASLPRPAGRLVWIHGASVGESLVALTLAERLTGRDGGIHVLVTSGTRTSANLVAERKGIRVLHQYVPVDRLDWVRRFLDHWQPDLAVFAESELWPNLVIETARAGTPMALVNARMNEASLKSWRRWGASARWLLACFDWIGPADRRTAEGLSALIGEPLVPVGNLKLEAAPALPDPEKLQAVREAVGGRPAWVAASTHAGEDETLIAAHAALLRDRPDALLILAPRHPERAGEIAGLLDREGLRFARRSAGDAPDPDTPVWLADTLGEMALWFVAAPAAFIAGSLVDGIGGHNPLEATRAGAAVISGPHVASFEDVYAAYREHDGVLIADSAEEIAAAVRRIWSGEGPAPEAAAAALAALNGGALDVTLDALEALLREIPETEEES